MVLTNLLDDLGIQTNNENNDDPNLKQGQELMSHERNYHAKVEPTLKLLEKGSLPTTGSISEGFKAEKGGCAPGTLSKDLTKDLNNVQKALAAYEKASSEYKKSLKEIKIGDPTYFNTVLVNNSDNSGNVINVYDEQLKDKVIGYFTKAKDDKGEWGPTCYKMYKDFNMGRNTWGMANNLVPIQDLFNNKCRTQDGSIVDDRAVNKHIEDPMSANAEGMNSNRNMCPIEYPIAFSGTSAGDKEKMHCCSSGVYKNECYGETHTVGNVKGPMSNYMLKIKAQKNGTEAHYTFPLQPWSGFAIGADKKMVHDSVPDAPTNGFIPVGVNRMYKGNYSIFWAHDEHDLGEENCPNDFVYIKNVKQAYMLGKKGKYGSDDWRTSFVDNNDVSGFFYISANEKISLANELVNILGQIVNINVLMELYHEISGNRFFQAVPGVKKWGEITPLDLLNPTYLKVEYIDENTVNPSWISKNNWKTYGGASDADKEEYKKSGLCISQFGAYFNSDGKNVNIKSPGDGTNVLTNPNNPTALGNALTDGELCGWNCIEECGPWSSFGLPDDHKLSKMCSNNQCLQKYNIGAHTFTRALVTSIQNLAMDVRGSKKYGNLSLDSLNELNELADKKQCPYSDPQLGYILGGVGGQEGGVLEYASLRDAKIGCDAAGDACAGITYNTGNRGQYELRSAVYAGKPVPGIRNDGPWGEISWLKSKSGCQLPDKKYDINTLETCQDLRNAYDIASYPKNLHDGKILDSGCATDDILAIYQKNCPNRTDNIVGPDPKKSRVKSRCPKDLLGNSGGMGGGLEAAAAGGGEARDRGDAAGGGPGVEDGRGGACVGAADAADARDDCGEAEADRQSAEEAAVPLLARCRHRDVQGDRVHAGSFFRRSTGLQGD